MKCPRCGSATTSTITISGITFLGCSNCRLPQDYFAAYKKEYETTPDCPFCDGLGELNYAASAQASHLFGPCLYCRLDEFRQWFDRHHSGIQGFSLLA